MESSGTPYITTDITGFNGQNQYLIKQAIGVIKRKKITPIIMGLKTVPNARPISVHEKFKG